MNDTDMSMQVYRSARRLRLLVWLGAGLAPAVTVLGLIGAWQGGMGPLGTRLEANGLPLGWASALALTQSVLVAAALGQLALLLGQVREGRLFPTRVGCLFGRFAALLFFAVLVHGPLASVIAAVLASPGGMPEIALDMAHLLALLVTWVLWLVARFFDAASRIEEDQRSFV